MEPNMDMAAGNAAAAGGAMAIVMMLIYAVIGILMLVTGWKLFVKMGKPGWNAIIPIYSTYVLVQALNKPMWWFIVAILFSPFSIVILWELCKAFGKGTGFFVATLFFGIITMPMLAFGSATFTAPPAAPAAPAAAA
jgi:hypothetical protein